MSDYLYYDGNEWIDPCIKPFCIIDENGNWQEINGVRDLCYYTGNEWKPLQCCTCPEGFEVDLENDRCIKTSVLQDKTNVYVFYDTTSLNETAALLVNDSINDWFRSLKDPNSSNYKPHYTGNIYHLSSGSEAWVDYLKYPMVGASVISTTYWHGGSTYNLPNNPYALINSVAPYGNTDGNDKTNNTSSTLLYGLLKKETSTGNGELRNQEKRYGFEIYPKDRNEPGYSSDQLLGISNTATWNPNSNPANERDFFDLTKQEIYPNLDKDATYVGGDNDCLVIIITDEYVARYNENMAGSSGGSSERRISAGTTIGGYHGSHFQNHVSGSSFPLGDTRDFVDHGPTRGDVIKECPGCPDEDVVPQPSKNFKIHYNEFLAIYPSYQNFNSFIYNVTDSNGGKGRGLLQVYASIEGETLTEHDPTALNQKRLPTPPGGVTNTQQFTLDPASVIFNLDAVLGRDQVDGDTPPFSDTNPYSTLTSEPAYLALPSFLQLGAGLKNFGVKSRYDTHDLSLFKDPSNSNIGSKDSPFIEDVQIYLTSEENIVIVDCGTEFEEPPEESEPPLT